MKIHKQILVLHILFLSKIIKMTVLIFKNYLLYCINYNSTNYIHSLFNNLKNVN